MRNFPQMKRSFWLLFSGILMFLSGSSSLLYAQNITTAAGSSTAGFAGDGAAATAARLSSPYGVAIDAAGNMYIADESNHRIRKVSTTGIITTIAGTGFGGYLPAHDGGPATAAWLRWPRGIAVDAVGNVYFSDYGNNIIRKISTAGIISTIAGTPGGIPSFSGDGGPATAANLGQAWGVAVDNSGNVFIADQLNHRIRKINTAGIITTVAGTGFAVFTADGVAATSSNLNEPTGVAVDAAGNIYIADNANNRVRKVNTSGIISTIAGYGLPYGYTGDGGLATAARLYYPRGIHVDAGGNVFIADWNNNVVRKINTAGIITTVAGNGTSGYSGDGGPATTAQLYGPTGVAVHPLNGDIYIADNFNSRIRRVKVGNEPRFTSGISRNYNVCPAEFYYIDSLLHVDDVDLGQTITWSPVRLPASGTLTAAYATSSTGSTLVPTGISYAPFTGYIGYDTFSVQVYDGTYYDTITIYANVIGAPNAGTITGADSVCPAYTTTLTASVPGGSWSSSSPSIATVTTAGIVGGVATGLATISYSVTNACGTAYAVHNIWVPATIPCITAVASAPHSVLALINIYPNPNTGSFSIQLPGSDSDVFNLTLVDALGRQLWSATASSGTSRHIPPTLPPGSYLLKAQLQNETKSFVIFIR